MAGDIYNQISKKGDIIWSRDLLFTIYEDRIFTISIKFKKAYVVRYKAQIFMYLGELYTTLYQENYTKEDSVDVYSGKR